LKPSIAFGCAREQRPDSKLYDSFSIEFALAKAWEFDYTSAKTHKINFTFGMR
jgi:hypothetical protein